eukprot:IDg16184t1
MLKEAMDDFSRFRRDRRINLVAYTMLCANENSSGDVRPVTVASRDIRVGDVLILDSDDRVPADCVLLRAIPNERINSTTDEDANSPTNEGQTGDVPDSLFIRTDQLDGETDWKLRRPITSTQALRTDADVVYSGAHVQVEEPKREIYDFVGNYISADGVKEPLSLENTLWANTVVASGRGDMPRGSPLHAIRHAARPAWIFWRMDAVLLPLLSTALFHHSHFDARQP